MIRNDQQLSINTKSMTTRQLKMAAIQASSESLQEVPLWSFPELYTLSQLILKHKLAKEMSRELRLKYSVQYCLRFLKQAASAEEECNGSCED